MRKADNIQSKKSILQELSKNIKILSSLAIASIDTYDALNNINILGNSNILIQIIMNLIQNSIDSYEYISKNDLNRKIILKAETDKNRENLIISVEDFGLRNI